MPGAEWNPDLREQGGGEINFNPFSKYFSPLFLTHFSDLGENVQGRGKQG